MNGRTPPATRGSGEGQVKAQGESKSALTMPLADLVVIFTEVSAPETQGVTANTVREVGAHREGKGRAKKFFNISRENVGRAVWGEGNGGGGGGGAVAHQSHPRTGRSPACRDLRTWTAS